MNAVEQLLLGSLMIDFKCTDLSQHDNNNPIMQEVLTHQTIDVPQDCGIMIELHNCEDLFDKNSKDGLVLIHTAVPDANFINIHPHCHAPKSLRDVHLLHGGGSGTAVFSGTSESLGNIVMKHGGAKDAKEVFSLIAIRQELSHRAMFQQQILRQEARAAARRMQRKIPEFVMAYISPFHTRNRSQELWASLRFGLSRNASSTNLGAIHSESGRQRGMTLPNAKSPFRYSVQPAKAVASTVRHSGKRLTNFSKRMSIEEKNKIQKEERSRKRILHVCIDKDSKNRWAVDDSDVGIIIKSSVFSTKNEKNDCFVLADGIDGLLTFSSSIRKEIADHDWKITLAQKAIGGLNPENGAHVLTSGKLCCNDKDGNDSLLHTLVFDFCQVMEDLSTLTYPRERCEKRLQNILQAVEELKEASKRVDNDRKIVYAYDDNFHLVSEELDFFVGSSIVKNFNQYDGRFVKLREFAADLMDDEILLTTSSVTSSKALTIEEDEVLRAVSENFSASCSSHFVFSEADKIPARFLAILLFSSEFDKLLSEELNIEDRIGINHVFVDPPSDRCALDEMEQRGWFSLLEHATSFAYDENLCFEGKAAALDCIWTCGLTDAGLHNTFITQERGLEFFDLGEPRSEPQPAFLTKFLMSYFHTAGMAEDENSDGTWVRRFRVVNRNGEQLLELTEKTKELIPYLHKAFSYTLDYFIKHLFYSDEKVRSLLAKYVILQLLSDSSFCISRWEEKGGGTERYGDQLKKPLEKWLWRSLWDQYIACYVYTNILLPCEKSTVSESNES